MLVKRLDQIIVGPGVHALYNVLFQALRSQQQDVSVRLFSFFPYHSAEFGTSEAGHHPIENHQGGRIVFLEDLPCLLAIAGDNDIIAPIGQGDFQQVTRDTTVVGYQQSHPRATSRGTSLPVCPIERSDP